MIIHLQRIFYNWEIEHNEKINSRLEFPKEINMKNYTIEHILNDKENKDDNIYFRSDEYYNYYLVGVIIHVGSADSGHCRKGYPHQLKASLRTPEAHSQAHPALHGKVSAGPFPL